MTESIEILTTLTIKGNLAQTISNKAALLQIDSESFLIRLLDSFPLISLNNSILTPHETEVMALVSEGLTSQQIGEKLIISPKIVKTHRTNAKDKLEAATGAGAISKAIRLVII